MNVVADLAEDFAEVERELAESVRYVEISLCMECCGSVCVISLRMWTHRLV